MLKKISSLLLAAVLTFSVFLPAFSTSAAEVDGAIVASTLSVDGDVTICLKPSANIKDIKGLQFCVTLPTGFKIMAVESKLDSVWEVYNSIGFSRFLIYNQKGLSIEETEAPKDGLYELFTLKCDLTSNFTSGEMLAASIKVEDISCGNNVANVGETASESDFVYVNSALSDGNFTYTTSGGTATITRYIGNSNEVEIPETFEEYPITCIETETFILNPSLSKITIPTNVISISDYAFEGCTDLTVYGEKDSYAEDYAASHGLDFVPLGNYYTITFVAPSGATLYELTVAEGECLADYYNEIVNIAVPDIYGYDKQIIDGLHMWSKDAYSDSPIFSDDTLYPIYLRRTDIITEILVTGVKGNTLLSANLPYDVAFSVNDELANSWFIGDAVVASGNTVKLYACGASMNVAASSTLTLDNNLSVVGTVLENNKLMVFTHGDIDGITEYGVIFTSKGLGDTLNEDTFTYETALANVPLKKAQITSSHTTANTSIVDFVGTLNIKSGATRYARAYAKSGNAYYYSNIIIASN